MIVSEARIAANRRNAAKSTGPRTDEGKAKSRVNSLKHGLCSSFLVPEDLNLIQQRSRDFFDTLMPQNELHVYFVDQAAMLSIRVERCERIERRCRDKFALRAELTWDNDRRLDAEVLGRKLSKNPAETAEALRKTPHGCDWLMSHWAMLAHAADTQQQIWTEEQTRLAFDLLGTPQVFRQDRKPGLTIDFDGRVLDPGDDPAAVARREIALLRAQRETVEVLDEVDQILASSDLVNEGSSELRRLRRYESTLHNRMRYCLAQVKIQSPYRVPDAHLRRLWVLDPEPDSLPEPVLEDKPEPELKPEPPSADEKAAEGWTPAKIHPPFDLTPDEYPAMGESIDLTAILKSRRSKTLARAEKNRLDRRRKVDRLGA